MRPSRVAVLGLGLIGGSVALRLTERGVEVRGLDPDPTTRELAAAAGIDVHEEVGAWLGDVDLVVLAGPLDGFAELMDAVAAHTEATVIDVGSVKERVHELADAAGLGPRFVGCHPMAGTELSGFAAASPKLLGGVTWALTAVSATEPGRVHDVLGFLLEHFDAQVLVLSPECHDSAAAAVSHVPHVLASALLAGVANASEPAVASAMAAGSFRDGTRVAGTNTRRTVNMVLENRAWVRDQLHRVVQDLTDLTERIDDDAAVAAWFAKAQVVREAFLGGDVDHTTVPADADVSSLLEFGREGWAVVGLDEDRYALGRGGLNPELSRERRP